MGVRNGALVTAMIGYLLFEAASRKMEREVETEERQLPYDSAAYTKEVMKLIQEAAEAAIPDWTRTRSGDFERQNGHSRLSSWLVAFSLENRGAL